MSHPAYDEDFTAWTQAQARILRSGRFDELESPTWSRRLKTWEPANAAPWKAVSVSCWVICWSGGTSRITGSPHRKSWRATIREQRRQIQRLLARNPSLKATLNEAVPDSYQTGVNIVVAETLDDGDLPDTCPFTIEEVLDAGYWPQ